MCFRCKQFLHALIHKFYRPDRDQSRPGFDMPSASNLGTEGPPPNTEPTDFFDINNAQPSTSRADEIEMSQQPTFRLQLNLTLNPNSSLYIQRNESVISNRESITKFSHSQSTEIFGLDIIEMPLTSRVQSSSSLLDDQIFPHHQNQSISATTVDKPPTTSGLQKQSIKSRCCETNKSNLSKRSSPHRLNNIRQLHFVQREYESSLDDSDSSLSSSDEKEVC